MTSVFIVFELGSGGETHVMYVCVDESTAVAYKRALDEDDDGYCSYYIREYTVRESTYEEPDVSEQQENEDFAQDNLIERDYGDE